MEELLVEIVCPASAKSYDFKIPKNVKVKVIIEKFAKDISMYEGNEELFPTKGDALMLFCYDTKSVINSEYTATEAGIVSGNKLMIL